MKIIIPTKKSRDVKFRDLWRVFVDSWRIEFAMLKPFPGRYPFASSIGHSQIEDKDPLRFFVLDREGGIDENGVRLRQGQKLSHYFGFPWMRTIINPKIVGHGNKSKKSDEACMSFPHGNVRGIRRWEIVDLEFWTFLGKRTKRLWLYRAALAQHEIDHMDLIVYEDAYRHNIKAKSSYERP